MEKSSKRRLVASTPHPQRAVSARTSTFANDTFALSPITTNQLKQPSDIKKNTQPKLKSTRHQSEFDALIPMKKKCVRGAKGAASNAVLEELKVNKEMLGANALSHSRNLYNMFPEPILLDSDEEDDLLPPRKDYKKPPSKKTSQTSKSAMTETLESIQDEDRRKKPVSVFLDSDEEDDLLPPRKDYKKPPSKKTSQTSKSAMTETLESIQDEDRRKKPVSVLLDSDEEDDLLPPRKDYKKPPSKKTSQTSKSAMTETLESIQDEDRRKKPVSGERNSKIRDDSAPSHTTKRNTSRNVKTVEKKLALDNVANIQSQKKENDSKKVTRKTAAVAEMSPSIVVLDEKENIFSLVPDNLSDIDEDTDMKTKSNSFPKECVSHFENVVFKRNTHFGATVAKCLDTGSNDFGYLEIEVNKSFIGTRPNTTFVVLEGQVQACQAGMSETFQPGDILHISSDAEYKFKNLNDTNLRLLYIREKRPTPST